MATRQPIRRFTAGFGSQPGRVKAGSTAFHAKAGMQNARRDMDAVIQKYANLIKHLEGVTPTVLHNALVPVFNRSQVYVPKKTGALMASGELRVSPLEGGKAQANITYGGSEAPYAAIVHEATWLNHVAPTSAKFLQRAMEEEYDAFLTSLMVDYSLAMGLSR